MYSSSPYTIPGAASISAMPMTSYTTATPMPYSGLDHTQGKWFAPGEALPAGFVVTAHPEGHTAPLETHSMSDKARESFVVTGTSVGAKLGSSMPAKKSSKESQRSLCPLPTLRLVAHVQLGTAAPISTTGYAGYAMEPMPYTVDGAPQVMYSSSPYTIPGAASISAMPMTSYTTATPMPYSGLDHTQGKWFAPGEALPAGFVVTAHPEGHTAPLETHSMSDKARESFVVTGTSVGAKLGSSMPAKKSSKVRS
ncbi:Uncharacterized protein SCF082_LOCUS38952 [Durusdinium trenchii]|uniref:Uncharacterized protein n=1 Tax=Durusdinium trenchii TaxID=1381693 RepID=A0ABP0Q0X0_9DINO